MSTLLPIRLIYCITKGLLLNIKQHNTFYKQVKKMKNMKTKTSNPYTNIHQLPCKRAKNQRDIEQEDFNRKMLNTLIACSFNNVGLLQ